MKPLKPQRWLATGLAAMAALAQPSAAASLGTSHGTALLGVPLDVTVGLVRDAAGGEMPACAAADVFYGDSRVEGGQVRTQLVGEGAAAGVRVTTARPVDTGKVIVYLHLGCGARVTRMLVLTAGEAPAGMSAQASPSPVRAGEPPAATPAAASQPKPPPAPVRAANAGTSREAPAGNAQVRPEQAPPAATRREAPQAAASASAPVARQQTVQRAQGPAPRLELGPALAAEADLPPLRLTSVLASAPAADGGAGRTTAAALWSVLAQPPEDLARAAANAAQVNQEVAQLRASVAERERANAQRSAAPAPVQAQVQAPRDPYSYPLLFGLALWSVVTGAPAAYLLWRQGRPFPWVRRGAYASSTDFAGSDASLPGHGRAAPEPGPVVIRDPAGVRRHPPRAGGGIGVDLDLGKPPGGRG